MNDFPIMMLFDLFSVTSILSTSVLTMVTWQFIKIPDGIYGFLAFTFFILLQIIWTLISYPVEVSCWKKWDRETGVELTWDRENGYTTIDKKESNQEKVNDSELDLPKNKKDVFNYTVTILLPLILSIGLYFYFLSHTFTLVWIHYGLILEVVWSIVVLVWAKRAGKKV